MKQIRNFINGEFAASAKTFDGSSKHGPQSYTLLTGFGVAFIAQGLHRRWR